jgi:hypothetical protein
MKSDGGTADPIGEGRQAPDGDLPPDSGEAVVPETTSDASEEPALHTPRLYRLRPAGLRPVRRRLRRHGLRNDCPPDQRRPPRSPFPRTRLR